jgi:hypothetical protein
LNATPPAIANRISEMESEEAGSKAEGYVRRSSSAIACPRR